MRGRTYGVFYFVTLLSIGIVWGAGWAEAKKKAPPGPPPSALAVQISKLGKQLPGVLLEDAGPIIEPIQKLVVDHMTGWMENRSPSDVEVRRELESAFSLLQYPVVGEPAVFAKPWKGGTVIGAGYSLGWNNFNKQNVVAIFDCRGGKCRLATVTNFVPYTDLHYEMAPVQGENDLRFFIYGFRPGKSQLRLTAIYYSFDGQTLKTLWENHELYDGKIDVNTDSVVFRYLKEEEYVHAVHARHKPPRHEATYEFTPAGMRLLGDHEIPF